MLNRKLFHYLGNYVKIISIGFTLLQFTKVIVIRNIYYLFPDSITILDWYKKLPDLRYTIIISIISLIIGWSVAIVQKTIMIINPFKQKKEEAVIMSVISLLFSYYFYKNFNVFGPWNSLPFLILSLFFFFLFTQIINFLKNYSLNDLREIKEAFVQLFTLKQIVEIPKKIYILLIFIILAIYSLFITSYSVNQKRMYTDIISGGLFITKITPQVTTFAYKVTLEGYNFGEEHDIENKLMSTNGKVTTSFWSDHKITFEVPLNWKIGYTALWIEKPHSYNKSRYIASNTVTLSIKSRWQYYPTSQDDITNRILKRIRKTFYLDYQNKF